MRISTNMIFDAGVGAINKQWASLLHVQQQIASGRRILTPADDPVGAARALEVQQAKDIVGQYATNQGNAKSALGLEEVQLTGVTDMFLRFKELVIQAGNGTLTDANRRSIATEFRAHFDRLLGIANATDGTGQYLFSGFKGDTKPFDGSVATGVQYFGDDGQRKLQVASGRQLEVGDSGRDVFERIASGNGTFATTYGTNSVTPGPNLGTGVIGSGTVSNPSAWVEPSSGAYTVRFSVAAGVTTYQLYDGAVALLATPATYTSGQPIALQKTTAPPADFGSHVVVTGAPADGDGFVVSPSTSQSVFGTLANLINALERGTVTAADKARYQTDLGSAIVNLDQVNENVLRVRAAVGSRLSEIDMLESINGDLALQFEQTLSNLQDLDYAAATAELARRQTDLEAAQKSFMSTSQLSLFNYL